MNTTEWREIDFLIDSGADISVISLTDICMDTTSNKTISGIGGRQRIGPKETYSIRFSCDRNKTYNVLLSPTKLDSNRELIILGRDFLDQFERTEFDWKNSRIRLGDTWLFYADSTQQANWKINDQLSHSQKTHIMSLLDTFPNTFAENPRAPRECTAVKHRIRTEYNDPVKNKIRRIPKKWSNDINIQTKEMLKNNIIEPSRSSYNSNVLLVPKKGETDNTKRFVVDYRGVNQTTRTDNYPLPCVEDLLDQFHGCNYFTQLDIASGYWNIPIEEKDRYKTAFSVPRGKFQFRRMPFGLKNAQATFQRCMDNIVEECKKEGAQGLDAYVDNIIVFSESFDEHLKTLNIVLRVLDEYNLSLRRDKCEFAFGSMEFLGFKVDGRNVRPGQSNLEKIYSFPTPTSRKALQRFLGLANYNRRFINRYSELCAPLNRLTSSKVPFVWSSVEQMAFDALKKEFHTALSYLHRIGQKALLLKRTPQKWP